MSALSEFRAALSGYAGLTALVGARIYPMIMPADTVRPAIVYQQVSGVGYPGLDNGSVISTENIRVQVAVYADTLSECKAVTTQIRGAAAAATGVKCVHVLELDDYEPDTQLFVTITDFSVWYSN